MCARRRARRRAGSRPAPRASSGRASLITASAARRTRARGPRRPRRRRRTRPACGRRSCAARPRRRRARARPPASVSARSNASLSSAVMFASAPACSASTGASISTPAAPAPAGRPRLARPPVEADRAREPVPAGGGEPRLAPAHAEADREDRRHAERAQVLDGRGDVGLDLLGRRRLDVRPVLEVLAALLDAGRAPEVVERERRVAALGEAQRQLLVEAVQPADVRKDHDARLRRLLGRRQEGCETVPVARLEHEVVVRDGRARDDRDRRRGVEVEAHGRDAV